MEPHNPIDHVVIMDFTDVTSQSEPNHLMLIAAASPIIDNANKNRTYQPQEPFNIQTLPKALEKAKLTWAAYGDPGFSYFEKIGELKGSPNILPWTRFDTDVAAGKLPYRETLVRKVYHRREKRATAQHMSYPANS